MSNQSTKRRLFSDDPSDSDSSTDDIPPKKSTSAPSHFLSEGELLSILQDSDFEENWKISDTESEENSEDDENDEDISGVYIVEPNTSVAPLGSPNPLPTNFLTAPASPTSPAPTVTSTSATPAPIISSPPRDIQPPDEKVWSSTPINVPSIPFEGNKGMLQVPDSNER